MRPGRQEGATGTVIRGRSRGNARIKAVTQATEWVRGGERKTQGPQKQLPERLTGLFAGSR